MLKKKTANGTEIPHFSHVIISITVQIRTHISGDFYVNLPKEISPTFQLPSITLYISESIFSSCEHCHNIQNTQDMFKVTYIL
jgi:hypothetical protein